MSQLTFDGGEDPSPSRVMRTGLRSGRHRIRAVDPGRGIGRCSVCGPETPVRWRPASKRWICRSQIKAMKRRGRERGAKWAKGSGTGYAYRRHKSDRCERCGFVPDDLCQLDVDHINGRAVDDPHDLSNLRTLCANCHRLRTHRPDLFDREETM